MILNVSCSLPVRKRSAVGPLGGGWLTLTLMRTPKIILDAQANWPEDEASLTAQSFTNRAADGYNADENSVCLYKDVAHMERVFVTESDGANLIARYRAALAKHLPQMLAVNLDAYMDSADINAHVAELLAKFPSDPVTYVSPIPAAYLNYARRKARAMDCRMSGLIEEARTHEAACDAIYKTIPALWRW